MKMSSQSEIIHGYNKEYRNPFNEKLFTRSDDDIIEEIKKVILSCQREGFFTIKVENFTVVEDYEEINKILFDYEETFRNKGKSKTAKKENHYSYINLKDSDIKLLIVDYYIAIKDEQDHLRVYIAIPRIVDKYYFRIGGNIYSAMYQIVDKSTYNNSTTTNSKYPSITMKTMFMYTRVYKLGYTLKTTKKESIKCVFYSSRIFNKSLGCMKYILGKYGLLGTFKFLGIESIYITDKDPEDDTMYTFCKNDQFYVSVPRYIFDADPMTQSLVCTIYRSIMKDIEFNEIFTNEYWVKSLGAEFNNFSIEKGESILYSLEGVYDPSTKEPIMLPEDQKHDIYCILRWIMREFNYLKQRDNTDMATKKIRYAEYIASLYAMKISKGIYRIADLNKRANIETIKKAINTTPMYLLKSITKCKLANYRNMVNDMDSVTALKFTYKGIAGLGEYKSNSVPYLYRTINPSHIGRVDLDSSSATDPGVTGTICPFVNMYGDAFSDVSEPNYWETEFAEIMKGYKASVGLKEIAIFKEQVLGISSKEELTVVNDSLDVLQQLIKPVYFANESIEECEPVQYLEGGNIIYYGHEYYDE